MKIDRAHPLVLTLVMAACPEGVAQTGSSGSDTAETAGDPSSSSSSSSSTTDATGDVPTTGEPTTTTDATTGEPTTGEPTTGGGETSVTRVIYHSYVDNNGLPGTTAARQVEIVDGVAMPAVTIVDPPGQLVSTVDATPGRRWSPYYTLPIDAPQLWLVDMDTLTSHEVALPPEVERVVTARVARDDGHLIVWTAPLDSGDGAEYTYYVCELGRAAECTLAPVESAAGPDTYVDSIHEISRTTGRIWYTAREIDGPGTTVLQGDVAAPEAAEPLGMFGEGEGLSGISLDEKTAYFVKSDGDELHAMDISVDPPGPLVEIHPPLPDVRRRWSDDEKDLLLHVGDGLWGDLFHITLDGAEAGPMVPIEAGGPAHVHAKSLQWISGRRVLFMGDQETPMNNQLYLADVTQPEAPPVKLSGPLQPGGELTDFHMRGDPDHVTYYAQLGVDTPYNLYRARIDPPGEIHQVNGPQAEGAFLLTGAFDASANGTRIVYAGSDTPGRTDLFLVDFTGEVPAAPVNVTSSLPPDLDVSLLGYLSSDASQVFFRAHIPDQLRGPLYMVQLSPEVGQPVLLSDADEWVNDFHVLPSK
jgi:hypothetical protein